MTANNLYAATDLPPPPPFLVDCAVSILPNLRRKLPPLTSWGNLILAHILQRNEVLFKISIRVQKKKKILYLFIIFQWADLAAFALHLLSANMCI